MKYTIKWDNDLPARVINRQAAETMVAKWTSHVTNYGWTMTGTLDGGDLKVTDEFGHSAVVRPVEG